MTGALPFLRALLADCDDAPDTAAGLREVIAEVESMAFALVRIAAAVASPGAEREAATHVLASAEARTELVAHVVELAEAARARPAGDFELLRLREHAQYGIAAVLTDGIHRTTVQGYDRAIAEARRRAAWSRCTGGVEVVDPAGEVVAYLPGAHLGAP